MKILSKFNLKLKKEGGFAIVFEPSKKTEFEAKTLEISEKQFFEIGENSTDVEINCFKLGATYMIIKHKDVSKNIKVEITDEQFKEIKNGFIIKDFGRSYDLGYL
jgi:hypothetical protein